MEGPQVTGLPQSASKGGDYVSRLNAFVFHLLSEFCDNPNGDPDRAQAAPWTSSQAAPGSKGSRDPQSSQARWHSNTPKELRVFGQVIQIL